MAITYKFMKVNGALGSKQIVCARATSHHTCDADELFRELEQATTLTAADLKAALHALSETVVQHLLDGDNVRLDGLGTFSVSVDGDVQADENGKYYLKQPHVSAIRFHPATAIQQAMKKASFTAASRLPVGDAVPSIEVAREAAKALLAEKPVFTASDFRRALQLSSPSAYTLLGRLVDEGTLRNTGSARRYLYAAAQ